MIKPVSKIPILLFPLKLETRFVSDELWIRVFPDEAFLQSHDSVLTHDERKDALAFKEHTTEEERRQAWTELVTKYGIYRSSWMVHISQEELELQSENENVPNPAFFFKWLPDRFVFYIYKEGDQTPAYQEDGSVIDRAGLTLLGEGDEWLQDFDQAIRIGLGIKMKINPDDKKFERVIVSGFRHDNDGLVPAEGLVQLLDNHRYTEGFSFLKYGSPTNNIGDDSSGYSAREEFEVNGSYEYAVKGLDLDVPTSPELVSDIHYETAGGYLSRSLGIENDPLKYVRHSDLTPSLLNELYQKASWFALGAQPLFMLIGNQLSAENHELIWKHYSKYVKAKGKWSAVKIGHQPYGILPVMNYSQVFLPENNAILESDQLLDRMLVFLARLMKRWILMAKGDQSDLPRLTGDDSPEDVLKVLSMQESSTRYQIRALAYRAFRRDLYEFAKKSNQTISTLSQLNGTGDGFETIHDNISSLSGLFDLNEDTISDQIDQFLRAPLLSFEDANAHLIGFDQGSSIIMDDEGKPVSSDGVQNDPFTFTEDDLGHFQEFIAAIKTQEPGELLQYRGDQSLFTDLFVRSYINASQLYFREIVFEPEIFLVSGSQNFRIGSIGKTENSSVEKGDVVMTIVDDGSKQIAIEAPFAGTIKKLNLNINDHVSQGQGLFTLFNESKYIEIKNEFINMGQQLVHSIEAIPEKEDRISAQKNAIGEVVDLNSYRLDAWITSLAALRIDEMRSHPDYSKGIYFGAYGWVEDLERDATLVNPESLIDIYRDAGGIIHAPGVAQVVASSVFKNSFLAHQDEGESNLFTVNLSSDRLQKSHFLLEGVRQGQAIEALLGYQLECHLHEKNLHQDIYTLREAYPLYENTGENQTGFVDLMVIDGLKAIRNKTNLPPGISSMSQVRKQIEKLEDTLDGSLDTLFYEAGYQVTQGNLSQAAAVIEATKGEVGPPRIDSLKTMRPGTGINHKLMMIFPPNTQPFTLENPRAFAEPNLEEWLKSKMGPMEDITCQVEIFDTEDDSLINTMEVSLNEVEISYLDLLYLCGEPLSDGGSELELRIRNVVWAQLPDLPKEPRYVIKNNPEGNNTSLIKLLEVARHTKSLLSKCRNAKSGDLKLEKEESQNDINALTVIKDDRFSPLLNRLKEISTSDLTHESTLKWLTKLDFESAKTAYLDDTPIDTAPLKSKVESKIKTIEGLLTKFDSQNSFDRAFEHLQNIANALFGEGFILLSPAFYSDGLIQGVSRDSQRFLVGDLSDNEDGQVWGVERVENWVQGVAQVHENTEIFEDWLMVQKVWNQCAGLTSHEQYYVAQGPTLTHYPWVALSKIEIDQLLEKQYGSQSIFTDPETGESYPLSDGSYYPDGCESLVVYAPESVTLEQLVFGLVIEEFSEHIPDQKMNTGLSFNYNSPDNEPPQALLMAIHPKAMQESEFFWTEDDLRDILYDTMDLYKIRMVDLEAIQEFGYLLPMTYWFHIPEHK